MQGPILLKITRARARTFHARTHIHWMLQKYTMYSPDTRMCAYNATGNNMYVFAHHTRDTLVHFHHLGSSSFHYYSLYTFSSSLVFYKLITFPLVPLDLWLVWPFRLFRVVSLIISSYLNHSCSAVYWTSVKYIYMCVYVSAFGYSPPPWNKRQSPNYDSKW